MVSRVGEPVVLRGHENTVVSASFSPDGRSVVTASKGGTARIWTLDPPTLRDQLRARATACLTPEQRKRYLAEPLADATAKSETCRARPRPDPGLAR